MKEIMIFINNIDHQEDNFSFKENIDKLNENGKLLGVESAAAFEMDDMDNYYFYVIRLKDDTIVWVVIGNGLIELRENFIHNNPNIETSMIYFDKGNDGITQVLYSSGYKPIYEEIHDSYSVKKYPIKYFIEKALYKLLDYISPQFINVMDPLKEHKYKNKNGEIEDSKYNKDETSAQNSMDNANNIEILNDYNRNTFCVLVFNHQLFKINEFGAKPFDKINKFIAKVTNRILLKANKKFIIYKFYVPNIFTIKPAYITIKSRSLSLENANSIKLNFIIVNGMETLKTFIANCEFPMMYILCNTDKTWYVESFKYHKVINIPEHSDCYTELVDETSLDILKFFEIDSPSDALI